MTQKQTRLVSAAFALAMVCTLFFSFHNGIEWGFFGHRKINRQAVFTLPPPMMIFFKKNIEYLTNHAVDPDMRRYAAKHEAVRHYIDLDVWGKPPFDNVPRNWVDMLIKFTQVDVVNAVGDTIPFNIRVGDLDVAPEDYVEINKKYLNANNTTGIESFASKNKAFAANANRMPYSIYKRFFSNNILPKYYEDEWVLSCDTLQKYLGKQIDCETVIAHEHFTKDGIVPYHLVSMQRRLTRAFESNDTKRILQLAAEFGHYIGDAHVPLHTTVNYNGQLTNQKGIHAFWESRLPELYADEEYDFWVGKARLIEDPESYYWDIVLTSHSYVDSVLQIEKQLFLEMGDRKYCFDERGALLVKTECQAYAKAYHQRLQGMVERRMRDAILAVGNAWYTAWVDAGQPNLAKYVFSDDTDSEASKALKNAFQKGEIIGREH